MVHFPRLRKLLLHDGAEHLSSICAPSLIQLTLSGTVVDMVDIGARFPELVCIMLKGTVCPEKDFTPTGPGTFSQIASVGLGVCGPARHLYGRRYAYIHECS